MQQPQRYARAVVSRTMRQEPRGSSERIQQMAPEGMQRGGPGGFIVGWRFVISIQQPIPAEEQAGVDAAEAEGVGQDIVHALARPSGSGM